ncbi:ribonuclease HII [Gulosibacter molinativorax]|uniref:Ribonuclease n=1 Tax=Gulosibacter molinativorax TaxID=256821 RepID=A0ABT7CB26_9MICO|nr:ribonuclease HII [Gulosibacter molinativorax]MDJ1372014.1 ribonuclease HII [Gulosibacter molinativorax]QUY60743.1 Ribonuclease HII [Gulosibacter molinativorax]
MTPAVPSLDVERGMFGDVPIVIGIDEVGRGALAGPVAVGLCALRVEDLDVAFPEGLRDSKLLSEKKREVLAPASAAWVWESAVGWASAAEIDEYGIGACLAAAAVRGLGELWQAGVPISEAGILLDGSHDWLTPGLDSPLRVTVRPKADRDCAVVAAASVIAKVRRDAHMRELVASDSSLAVYGWESNKGYGSAAHREAIIANGPSGEHRRSWLSRILTASS